MLAVGLGGALVAGASPAIRAGAAPADGAAAPRRPLGPSPRPAGPGRSTGRARRRVASRSGGCPAASRPSRWRPNRRSRSWSSARPRVARRAVWPFPPFSDWPGPVVATSVKSDLLRDTRRSRAGRGQVWCIDPTASTGMPGQHVVALDRVRRLAPRLPRGGRPVRDGPGRRHDGRRRVLVRHGGQVAGPAALGRGAGPAHHGRRRALGGHPGGGARWPTSSSAPAPAEALAAARASWCRDDRTRSSVYTTAETVLAPFALAVRVDGGAAVRTGRPARRVPHAVPVCARS